MTASPIPRRRLHDLDAMRSVLMLLGIVLHSANPFRPGSSWLIVDPGSNSVFQWLVQAIHRFRMPAFFVVAGYFALLAFDRRSPSGFARERATRLLLPCFVTLVLLNLPQVLFLAGGPPGAGGNAPQSLSEAWWSGALIGHLWFLVILFIHCLLLAVGGRRLRELVAIVANRWPESAIAITGLTLIGAMLVLAGAVVAHLISGGNSAYLLGLADVGELLGYFPFFLIGLLLWDKPRALHVFQRPRHWDLGLGLIALLAERRLAPLDTPLANAAGAFATAVVAFVIVRCCFAIFHHLASAPSSVFRYLSEASYTLYLLHHLVIVVLASMLVPFTLAIGLKFLILVLASSLVGLLVHHFVVRRWSIAHLLLNGRPLRNLVP